MRKHTITILALGALLAGPALASAASFNNVSVIDVSCSKKAAADPDSHTRACALKCAGSGYGIVTEDKKYLKFDAAGNAKITEALKASDKKDHLRVNVDGDVQGDTIKVTSVKLL